jgi:hypothetical protein
MTSIVVYSTGFGLRALCFVFGLARLMHVPLARRGAETRTTENKNPENKVTVIHKINYKVTGYLCTFVIIKTVIKNADEKTKKLTL